MPRHLKVVSSGEERYGCPISELVRRTRQSPEEKEEEKNNTQPVPEFTQQEVRNLLEKKLADPMCPLSESESIEMLMFCISAGAENAKKIIGNAVR